MAFVTDITQQMNMLALGEARPWYWAVGQTLYAGPGGASLTHTNCRAYFW